MIESKPKGNYISLQFILFFTGYTFLYTMGPTGKEGLTLIFSTAMVRGRATSGIFMKEGLGFPWLQTGLGA